MALEMISTLAGISGLSLKDAIKLSRNNEAKKQIVRRMSKYLALLAREDDPLCGLWRLKSWDYIADRLNSRFVSGWLAIMYQEGHKEKWQSSMFLEYRKYRSNFMFFAGNGPFAHRLGLCFSGLYEVELMKTEAANFYGSSSLSDSIPPSGFRDSGEFFDIQITPKGELKGCFKNHNSRGQSDFVFHQRKKWQDYERDILG